MEEKVQVRADPRILILTPLAALAVEGIIEVEEYQRIKRAMDDRYWNWDGCEILEDLEQRVFSQDDK